MIPPKKRPTVLKVIDDEDGDKVLLQLHGRRTSQILTPKQAKALAKKLVEVANFLEVRKVMES